MIRFGAWSMLLAVPAAQALVVAVSLLRVAENRRANLYLSALLVVLAGMLTPFILGYAGFYDLFPWLSFAPFAVPLLIGPLVYGYVRALVTGERLRWPHFAAGAAQFLYQLVCFVQPLAFKAWFDTEIQRPYLGPLASAALIASLAAYGGASVSLVRRYRRAGAGRPSALGRSRRLAAVAAVLILLLVARSAFDLFDALVAPLDYFDLFGFYVLLALATAFLSLEGWRQAWAPFPPIPPERDWAAQGREWRMRLAREQWWREPDLSLAELSRRLATNETHLSRALGASGAGFSDTLAALRAEEAARLIRAGDERDLLSIALDSGFGSKASFNRAFKQNHGASPSEFRRAWASQRTNIPAHTPVETTR